MNLTIDKAKPKTKHKEKVVGALKVVCPASQWWHVTFKGQVLASKTERCEAIRIAEHLNKRLDELLPA